MSWPAYLDLSREATEVALLYGSVQQEEAYKMWSVHAGAGHAASAPCVENADPAAVICSTLTEAGIENYP
jgi:hypothetical protein